MTASSPSLGLFDNADALQHVGVCASFSTEKRRELANFIRPYRTDALASHPWKHWADQGNATDEAVKRIPGGQSRWSQGKDLSWEPLRPELVVEVAYDHMQGSRFRHTAQFRRWRPDKRPSDCTYAQHEEDPPQEQEAIFSSGRDYQLLAFLTKPSSLHSSEPTPLCTKNNPVGSYCFFTDASRA